ncbi:Holliday junction branch migration protein RuvA [Mycoplasma sp. 3686d]|uniref:Holliday junction branch migration protein RuvA n=1 Tax=Mycoplasma sp. 3686d TaxID=2967300 RepID=UPI00211D00D2|nr:Holliday junction branch migration protein RuvA [Mycoplasma sp. 3686d]UUM24545.1 Holliday junction branch migration protein RuvA [Mycoplasma sp. 3686d]
MKLYILGKIVYKKNNKLILESQSQGHIIVVPNHSRFQINEQVKIYVYEHETEYNETTYGFKDFQERELFMDLVLIGGIQPQFAILILDKGWKYITKFIAQQNEQALSKLHFFDKKTARLVCKELANKWVKIINN